MTSVVRTMAVLLVAACLATASRAASPVVIAVPAQAGPVDGMKENSDAFIWRLFTEFATPVSKDHASPVAFETWASDEDTFSANPHWPEPGEPLKFHASVLEVVKTLDSNTPLSSLRAEMMKIDVACEEPRGAAVGAFPVGGTPTACMAEQVARNRAQFDYIVNNKLNTQAGLAAAYAKSLDVEMPEESIAIKADWVPLPTLLRWVPDLADIAAARTLYYTATVGSVEYALVAMHVSSRQNPNWVWGTFEHQMNPGRCDAIGCFDSFGAEVPAVPPNRGPFNKQYGPCTKTQRLHTMMTKANLSSVWENYCLKSTQVDFTAADGTPYALGNSVIEGIFGNGTVAASSCITCHYYASFGQNGSPTASARAILPFNPTGNPIADVLKGSRQFAFMWGVLRAPP
jgi:hypothetical protein